MTYSINWPITVRSAVPFRKLYLPPDDDNQPGTSNPSYSVPRWPHVWFNELHVLTLPETRCVTIAIIR